MRGENCFGFNADFFVKGTSPRARGKPDTARSEKDHKRNIPACAGKTELLLVAAYGIEEHPRVRGENEGVGEAEGLGAGTSPRARGKRGGLRFKERFKGNIPACAGKTEGFHDGFLSVSEHPRVRGENPSSALGAIYQRGTSPRARGKHVRSVTRSSSTRNIPACAGKTLRAKCSDCCWEEHPRVRGENSPAARCAIFFPGTSPRARGKRD